MLARYCCGPGDRADPPVPERQQVLGRGARTRGVRGRDGRNALVERDAGIDDHERVALATQDLELAVRLLRQHQHRAVGRTVHETVEQRDLALVMVQRGAEHHPHVLLVERLGRPREDRHEVGRLDDRQHHADQSRAAAREGARAAVRGEAAIAHDAHHRSPRLLGDARPLVEDARDRGDRDAGRARDLADRRAVLAVRAGRRHDAIEADPWKRLQQSARNQSHEISHSISQIPMDIETEHLTAMKRSGKRYRVMCGMSRPVVGSRVPGRALRGGIASNRRVPGELPKGVGE